MTDKKVLVFCGPTASGKTALALTLARTFDGELISADSRQVYTGMDIVTGKDLPKPPRRVMRTLIVPFDNTTYTLVAYDMGAGIPIWLYDVVSPDEEFSVAHFIAFSDAVTRDIWERKKLPIVVGGSALYVRSLLAPPETLGVPRDEGLRRRLATASVSQLQAKLDVLAPGVLSSMNESDRKNPRRLIRKLEIAAVPQKPGKKHSKQKNDVLAVGIMRGTSETRKRIAARVRERIREGALEETAALRASGYGWQLPALTGVGYRHLHPVVEGNASLFQATQSWERAEVAYAKAQMLFFKKIPQIFWFDVSKRGAALEIEQAVATWYTRARHE
jgi:tRNA dimethylallyltransferase